MTRDTDHLGATIKDNCHPVLHEVKRRLSRVEKQTLLTTSGRALVLPGHPPRQEGHQSEIHELIAVGYGAERIAGVEIDEAIADELYDYFRDSVQIHFIDVGEFLANTRNSFSYIHLDFCQQLSDTTVTALENWRDHLSRVARLRVSTSYTRRLRAQIQYEEAIRKRVILPLLHAAQERDTPGRWDTLIKELETSEDTSQLVAAIMLVNHFFGLGIWDYADMCLEEPVLPHPRGPHILQNLQRFIYREEIGHTNMHSAWVDAVALDASAIPHDVNWLLDYLHMFFTTAATPAVPFHYLSEDL